MTITQDVLDSDLLARWAAGRQPTRRRSSPKGVARAGLRFAFCGRISTEDYQDKVSSARWQLDFANELVGGRGRIVAEFFDIGYSRRLPWPDRPQAAALLAAVADTNRGFDAIVVGEYERAFYGDQLLQMAPLFERHGVQLWLPELDGPVDITNPTHVALIMLLGVQSKREVQRARFRVIAAMRAQAREQGRHLGGRPPYGYRLVDAGPHPNTAHARWGRRLHRLEPDPVTAPHVRWMFAQRLAGRSFASIARDLNRPRRTLPVRRRPGPQPAPPRASYPARSGQEPDKLGWEDRHVVRRLLLLAASTPLASRSACRVWWMACAAYALPVICFDTNVIRDTGSREGTLFTLLRGLARLTGHPLALPQTVLDELMGHYERTITEAHATVERIEQRQQADKPEKDGQADRLVAARDVLLDLIPWWIGRAEFYRGDNSKLPLIASACRREDDRLRKIFHIVPKPAGADEEGNRREIARQLPALHDGDSGKGSRDAAIWLTVLDAARGSGTSLVFFISKDGGFASKGGRRPLRPELRAEADRSGAASLVFYSDVDQLIGRLSCVTTTLPEPIETLIASEPAEAAVHAHLRDGDFRIDLTGWRSELGYGIAAPDDLVPQPRVAAGHDTPRVTRVGETTLVAFNRVWYVTRRYRVPAEDGLSDEKTAEFTVLFSLLVSYVDDKIQRVQVVSRGGVRGQAGL